MGCSGGKEFELQLLWEVSFARFNATNSRENCRSWSWAWFDSQIKFRNIEKYGPGCWNIKDHPSHVNRLDPTLSVEIKSGILRLSVGTDYT